MRIGRVAGLLLAITAMLVLATPAHAGGGGGCRHTGITTGTGTVVDLKAACFTPTMIRISAGQTVTWVNRDDMVHNVVGSGFTPSSEDLAFGQGFRFRFTTAGVYPYACYYHPGMVGAVIVGDGTGPGPAAAEAVAELGVTLVPKTDPIAPIESEPVADTTAGGAPWIGLAIGLGLVGTATGFSIGRSRSR